MAESAFDRAHGKALHQAVQEEIVGETDGQSDDQRGGQQRLPKVDIAQDKFGGHADAEGALAGVGDEDQGIDEFVQGQREGEDDG